MTASSIADTLTGAQQHHQANRLDDAARLYERVLAEDPNHVDALRLLGMVHAQQNKVQSAIDYLKRAVALRANDASLQHHLASLYATQNQYQQALHHYHLALQIAPDFIAAHHNLGLLFLKHGELAAAKTQFNNVLSLNENRPDALFYLGVLHLQSNDLELAEKILKQLLSIVPEHVEALCNLGVIALKRDQRQLAIDYFTKALVLDEHHVESRNNLAATFIHFDRFENALMHYDVLLKKDPTNIEYLYNMGVAQMSLGHLSEAKQHFENALTVDNTHFATLNNLAVIHIRTREYELAIDYLNRALQANPNDSISQFMLQALTNAQEAPKPCTEYVNNLFDNYALYYDQHMTGALQYALPRYTGQLLHELNCLRVQHTLDLGCGSGLTGVVLREPSQRLTGVDLSAKMLEQAREKCIYDDLIHDDVIHYLETTDTHYQLIVANDVLPYLGDLSIVFFWIQKRLNIGGLFIFSVEISQSAPWMLQKSARFCHHPDYIKTVCNDLGLKILIERDVVARQQEQEDCHVLMYVVQT